MIIIVLLGFLGTLWIGDSHLVVVEVVVRGLKSVGKVVAWLAD